MCHLWALGVRGGQLEPILLPRLGRPLCWWLLSCYSGSDEKQPHDSREGTAQVVGTVCPLCAHPGCLLGQIPVPSLRVNISAGIYPESSPKLD